MTVVTTPASEAYEAGPKIEYTIERSSHSLVGWVDYLIVSAENPLTAYVQNKIDNYPVLDEDHLSEYEMENGCYDDDEGGLLEESTGHC